jgi:hypothetical protein
MVNFLDISDTPIVKSLSIPDHLTPQPIHHAHLCWRCIYSYCGGWESRIQEGYQIPKNFRHAANCLAQLVNMARYKAWDPSDIPPTEDIERIVKYSKALLSVISAWEAVYKKKVKAAGGPAAFRYAHEKSSELHMEHLKVWQCGAAAIPMQNAC